MNEKMLAVLEKIKEYKTIIIHRHVLADGDAYGSQLGLKRFIKLNFPDKEVYAVGQNYDYLQKQLGDMDEVSDNKYKDALVIVTDCGNVERIDDQRFNTGKFLIKIDHHPNVTPYGDLMWVDTSFTSASEMIGYFVKESSLKVNAEVARTIFLGIVTDSQRFMIDKTTPRTFEVAAYLLKTGFNMPELYHKLYEQDLEMVKARSELINNHTTIQDGVSWTIVDADFLKKHHVKFSENGLFSGVIQNVKGVDIWVTFAANADGTWRVEFRSKAVPINEIAIKYGGGGHVLASGAIIKSLDQKDAIIKDLQNLLKK